LSVLQGVQLAILEPWLRDALALRSAQILTPSAPTELSVITLVFMVVSFAQLFVIGKIFFFSGLGVSGIWQQVQAVRDRGTATSAPTGQLRELAAQPRALLLAESVSQVLRREERGTGFDRLPGGLVLNRPDERTALAGAGGARVEALGEHLRLPEARRYARGSNAGRKRYLK
jgi:type IV secretion system protein VirB6